MECQRNSGVEIRGRELTRIIRPIVAKGVLRTRGAPVLILGKNPVVEVLRPKRVVYILL